MGFLHGIGSIDNRARNSDSGYTRLHQRAYVFQRNTTYRKDRNINASLLALSDYFTITIQA